jgi:hypothetical protein
MSENAVKQSPKVVPRCQYCHNEPLQLNAATKEVPDIPAGQPIPILQVIYCARCGAVFSIAMTGIKMPDIASAGNFPPSIFQSRPGFPSPPHSQSRLFEA